MWLNFNDAASHLNGWCLIIALIISIADSEYDRAVIYMETAGIALEPTERPAADTYYLAAIWKGSS